MATTARVIALAQKYRCRPLPAASRPKKRQKAAKQTVLPPVKTVHSLAEYNIAGARFNPTELVVEGGLSESEWLSIGRAITHVESSSKWWIGDWLNAGMKAFGKGVAYSLAVQATAQERHSLYHTAWTASKFEPHRRIGALSFSHHQAVAALPADVADRLLKEALELGLTAEQIYQAGREECGKKRKYNIQKVGVYLSDETLAIVQNLARVKSGKRLAWFLNNIVCEWLVDHGHRPPKKAMKEIYDERRAAGLCVHCGKNVPSEGKHNCESCLAAMRTYDYFRRHEKQVPPQLGE